MVAEPPEDVAGRGEDADDDSSERLARWARRPEVGGDELSSSSRPAEIIASPLADMVRSVMGLLRLVPLLTVTMLPSESWPLRLRPPPRLLSELDDVERPLEESLRVSSPDSRLATASLR